MDAAKEVLNYRDPKKWNVLSFKCYKSVHHTLYPASFYKTHLSQADFLGVTAAFEHCLENSDFDFCTVKDVRLVEDLRAGLNISSLQISHTKPAYFNFSLLNTCKIVTNKPTWQEGKLRVRNCTKINTWQKRKQCYVSVPTS